MAWDDDSMDRYIYWQFPIYVIGTWLFAAVCGPGLVLTGSVALGIVFTVLTVLTAPLMVRWWRRKWLNRPRKPAV